VDWRRLLLNSVALVGVLLVPVQPPSGGTITDSAENAQTSASNSGEQVTLEATTPGSPGSDDTGDFVLIGGDGGAASDDSICIRIVDDRCYVTLSRPEDAVPGTPTLSDIASFRPEVGTAHMQPNGWGVVGIHTNFYSIGGAHVVTGTLLGQPASVRFTPIAWHWDYGDGTAATAGAPGGTWAQLGIREFDATPGSHVYATKGGYTVRLGIEYTAEYQFAGQPWLPIPGSLLLSANDLSITTWNVKTVLVAEDCLADPSAPGCPGE
jgi:hypothetical protein